MANDANLKQIVLLPALNALLQPTAETLGSELNERVVQWIDNRRDKRRTKNVSKHLEEVRKRLAASGQNYVASGEKQLDFFEEWVDGVEGIETGDEIAAIWHGLMASVVQEQADYHTAQLAALKSISPTESAFLVEVFKESDAAFIDGGQNIRFLMSKLGVSGFVDLPPHTTLKGWAVSIVISILIVYGGFKLWGLVSPLLPFEIPTWLWFTIILGMNISFLVSGYRNGKTYRLSGMGKELLSYVRSPK